ncbi:Hydrogen peroxide-inducible genes activator [Pseudovibrio sp. Ad46]|uniref:LysR substrate-binding domain-containing protein n=1 Tax=unclassified Pseudovibrio TaxID=2627060 RepID=UPI0007AEB815|nr:MULTISPECIES: LysR substrate-binding domain-containing protein [unclassified Pseudovibrio]KZK90594.1 Hydrogen peroxide-inducible genes activator [Pseudovibrio sp. Ad46]KZK92683.1 Hydrogen peroxide-inducible genes activator [Pseudovibrio sp. Ad5]
MSHLPSLRQLEFLVALVEEQHFGKAAEKCNVSQSALSTALKELEQNLGVHLAERTKRSVTITPLGNSLADRARHILLDTKAFVDFAAANSKFLSGDMKLGVISTVGPYLLPGIMPQLRKKFPELRLFIKEGITHDLLAALQSGHLDAVLLALPFEIGDLVHFPLFEDGYKLAVTPQHPLANRQHVEGQDLTDTKMMLLEKGHCLQQHALSAFLPDGPVQDSSFEATSLSTLVGMVAEGLGTTLLPDVAITAGLTDNYDVCLIDVDKALPREIALVWRKSSPRGEELQHLGEFIKQAYEG